MGLDGYHQFSCEIPNAISCRRYSIRAGNVITVLGGSVNGGTVYGTYPGLGNGQLYENVDVAVTADYRRVISEALIRRMGNPNVYYAFPGYSDYTPIGIFQGVDLPPGDYDSIFRNGFEGA